LKKYVAKLRGVELNPPRQAVFSGDGRWVDRWAAEEFRALNKVQLATASVEVVEQVEVLVRTVKPPFAQIDQGK
jgi:hypothetical protein